MKEKRREGQWVSGALGQKVRRAAGQKAGAAGLFATPDRRLEVWQWSMARSLIDFQIS